MRWFSFIASIVAALAVLQEVAGRYDPMHQMEDKCGCCPKPCCCHCVTEEVIPPTTSTSTSTSTSTTTPAKCHTALDLAFCVDSSGSVAGEEDWVVLKSIVRDISCQLPIGKDSVRVAMVTYSNNASLAFDFNSDYNENCDSIWEGIKDIPRMGDFTNTPECLEMLTDVVFPLSGRPGVPRLAIVLTDGRLNFRNNDFEGLAKKLQSVSDLVIAIALPSVANQTQLEMIATGEGDSNVFNIGQLDELFMILGSLLETECEASTTSPAIPITTSPETPAVNVEECFCCCPPPPAIYHDHQQWGYGNKHGHSYTQNHGRYKSCLHF